MKNNLFEIPIKLYGIEDLSAAWKAGDDLFQAACDLQFKQAEPEKLAAFLTDVASKLDENHLVNFLPGERMPADGRMGMIYQPTYATIGAVVYARNNYPQLLSNKTWEDLSEMCNMSFSNGFQGHGYETDEFKCRTMLMLCSAGVRKMAKRELDLFDCFLDYVSNYVGLHETLEASLASPENPDGEVRCFWDWSNSRANAYIRQLCAAWNGKANTVFVYGSLLHGERADEMLKGAVSLGEFVLNGYEMFDLGSYPGIKPNGQCSVCGEVYCVDDTTLSRLDHYEGEGVLYTRKRAMVRGEYGSVSAMFYEYAQDTENARRVDRWHKSDDDDVWYAAYGSNLNAARFRCYLQGGTCAQNGHFYSGCSDKREWMDSKVKKVSGRMYFGNHSSSWNGGGVAFFDESAGGMAIMRLYKINRAQLHEIQCQEGMSPNWYGRLVRLGNEQDGCPIYTFTAEARRSSVNPDPVYLNLIKTALIDECGYNAKEVEKYLQSCLED